MTDKQLITEQIVKVQNELERLNKLLQDETMLDNQLLMVYLRDNLKGVVGDAYSNPYGDGRITILTDTQQEEIPVTGDGMVFVLSLPVLAAAVLLLMLKRKPR